MLERKLPSFFLLWIVMLSPLARLCQAQTTSFLSDEEIRMLSNEISGDRAFEHIRWLSHWHRDSGMEGYFKAAEYVMKAAKEAGLEDVRFIEQPLPGVNYTARSAELWMVEPVELKLADIGDHAVYLSDGSHDADLKAELVYIGDASEESLKGLDVKGKLVLTTANPQTAVQNTVYTRGAVGVVSYTTTESKSAMDFPDQVAWTRIDPQGEKQTFAFALPPRKGDTLRRILQTNSIQDFFGTGKRTKGGRVVLKAKVDTEISAAPGRTGFVEGWIRGSSTPNQQIILTAHLQEEQGSANDDGSGCGNLLELARTFKKLIAEGKMTRPARDMRFWWTDEIYSEYRYFMDNPQEPKKFLANIHQDMTGADQALGSRVQHLIFAPHSRTSYLDAIFESVGTYLINTNNAFLAASRQGGLPRPHTRPLYSTRGSRQGYNARFVPWFGSSDHMTFLDGPINTPAVALVNWDDYYIHSSDDDIDKIDQTQLRRNNFLIGSIAYFLSRASDRDVPTLAAETYAQGVRRLGNDLRVAMSLLKEASAADDKWKEANFMIEQGVLREQRALNTIRVFATPGSKADASINEFNANMKLKAAQLIADLETYYSQLHARRPGPVSLSAEESAALKKIPVNNPSIKDYFENRGRVRFRNNLHGLMRDEVYNFVDGQRSYYDI
jgi:Peptidase family M28